MITPPQYGSCLPYKSKRIYYFVFGYTNGWWGRYLKGYTHVALLHEIREGDNAFVIGLEPMVDGCRTLVMPVPTDLWPGKRWEILVVVVANAPRKNRLIRPVIQTCATIVQYIAGVSLGVITAHGLYSKLTNGNRNWLQSKGIVEVAKWESKQPSAQV